MGLNRNEIEQLIAKLRDRYARYAKKHNTSWFNISPFEERLEMAVQKKMNLEGFILSEISYFEKLREKYEKKKKEKPFTALVDSILEQYASRIKKYPPIFFHPEAHLEMVHLYGALRGFASRLFPVLRLIIKEAAHKTILNEIDMKLGFLAVPQGTHHSKRVADHVMVLSRPAGPGRELENERDKNNYLREAAFILHEIHDFCGELMNNRDPDWDLPLRFDRLYLVGETKKNIIEEFSPYTGCGAIIKVQESAASIIEDFRLGAFNGKPVTSS